MEMYYGSKGIENYLEVNLGEKADIECSPGGYRVKMLEENDIEYLFRPITLELDGKLMLKYNTQSYYVMDRFFSRFKPDGSFLNMVLSQLTKCISELERFLLEPNDIVLKPEYMFYNWGEKKIKLICIPGYGKSLRIQLKAFFEYIMKIFDHRDDSGVRMMYEMYDRIASESFSMADFSCLDINNYSETRDNYAIEDEKNVPVLIEAGVCGQSMPLYEESHIKKLVPLTNGALAEIKLGQYEEMILVGRGKKENDYRLATTQISRVHACIYLRDNGVFVEDRESTNGTFINSVRLPALQQTRINVGDIVGFANEEFFAV